MDPESSNTVGRQIEFTGQGGEYFRIWVVNLALTILTLGIYSAWAKVRRLQYFYRNTSLMGNSFDYHGDPVAILKGRIIGVGLLAIYHVTLSFSIGLGLVVFVLLVAALPWLPQRSICFRLINSSYRGLRFRFNGSMREAYQAFLGWPVAAYLSAGFLAPMAHQRVKAYQHNNSAYGTSPFSFSATPDPFYIVYLKLLGMTLLLGIVAAVIAAVSGVFSNVGPIAKDPVQFSKFLTKVFIGFFIFYLLLFLVFGPWFAARIQNLVWNHTALGPHSFASNVRARDLLVIYLTNFIAIILTLGFFKPFADIRLARYRLTHMALNAQGNLDEFFAQEQQAVNAMGEETANVFDVDISF
jgi:uncharacterized membrane protein YjgN (DUF898 family)